MGGQKQGGVRLRLALIAAAAFVLPASAYAQDSALDIESRFTAIEDRTDDVQFESQIFRRDADRAEPPRVELDAPVLIGPLSARTPITCVNGETPRSEFVRRIVGEASAGTGATFTTNAQESESGDDDIVVSGVLKYQWTRRSGSGLCRSANPQRDPAYDPRWAFSATAAASGLHYVDGASTDATRFAVTLGFNTRLFENSRTQTLRYRTRLNVQVVNAVNYSEFYDDWASTTHDARATLSHTLFGTSRGSAGVSLTAGHVFANPERNSYDHASFEAQRIFNDIGGGWRLTFTASAGYRDYTDAIPIEFDETRYGLSAKLTREIAPNVNFDFAVNLDSRESDIPAREFDAASAPISIGISRSF